MKIKTSGIILTAAEADITICEVFGSLPTGLIPVNGKPIIFFILEQFLEAKILDVYIGIDFKKEKIQDIINLYFKDKFNIRYILTDKSKGVGNSLLKIISMIKTNQVIVNLADTYIKNLKLNTLEDSIIVSNDYLNEERWATLELSDNKTIKKFYDKVKNKNALVLCGVYSFSNISVFDKFSVLSDNVEITEILNFYNMNTLLRSIKTDDWLDFGHIDKYYVSKKKLIQSRGFNSLEYDDLLGTITKRSKNKEKFISEIKWQLDLPKNIQVLAPRILDYSISDNPFITMEFYSYPTLSEIWLFSELNEKIYFSIIDKLFKILELFKENKYDVSYDSYISIYINKTEQRINQIENKDILSFMQDDNILINGKVLKNWNYFETYLFKEVEFLYNSNDNCFIHGDFCLSNILYDLRSGLVRVIDPRGIWGDNENGDIKYDIAKLSHSIIGDYDYIVNDLFQISIKNNEIEYTVYNSEKDKIKKYFNKILSKHYDINQIKLIEGLLFLSMIPLHEDNYSRQLLMYAKAIELFNDIKSKII